MKKQVEYLQKMFYQIWNDFGSVYLLVKHSDRTNIGRRGFTEDEKKQGLVLVFNNKTSNTLEWDVDGNVSCVLAFGARKENVSIHHDDLFGVFSPEAGIQFVRSEIGKETEPEPAPAPTPEPPPAPGPGDGKHVVSLANFKKKKHGDTE